MYPADSDPNETVIQGMGMVQEGEERQSKKDGACVCSLSAYLGVNIGEDAGQTVFHVHVHLIPRRAGDMPEPKGGVRGVIPEKQKY